MLQINYEEGEEGEEEGGEGGAHADDSSNNKGSKCFTGCEKKPTKLHSEREGEKQLDSENKDEMWRNYIRLTVEDVVGKKFQCFQDAYKFYCDYAMCCKFVVCKDDEGKNKSYEI